MSYDTGEKTCLVSVKDGSVDPLAGLICIFKHISKAAADFSDHVEGKAKRLLVFLSTIGLSQPSLGEDGKHPGLVTKSMTGHTQQQRGTC